MFARGASVLGLAGAVFGCGEIIGASDYQVADGTGATAGSGGANSHAPPPSGGAATDGGHQTWPILPAIPDESRKASCTQCAEERCGDLWRACIDDPWCLQMLDCKSRCDDPDCLFACTDRYPESRDFDDYWNCVYGEACQLDEECGLGRNFDCTGQYRWEGGEDNLITVDLALRNIIAGFAPSINYMAGLELRACVRLDCLGSSHRDGPVYTDGAGHARFEYTVLQENDLFVEISGGSDRERYLYHDTPYRRDAVREIAYYGRRNTQAFAPASVIEAVTDDTRPVVWVQVRDCLSMGAPDVVVELPEADSDTVRVVGPLGSGNFAGTSTGPDGRVVFLNVPHLERVTVVANRLGDSTRIAERLAFVRTNWWTEVKLYPDHL